MKKLLLVLILGFVALGANSGEDIYKAKCASCHAMKAMMDKAPPMPKVSKRLKMMLTTREDFIAFVDDYIQNPSQKKGFCMPMAYQRFGTMPPIGKQLSKEERVTVAAWLHDNFKGSWDRSMDGKMCGMRNKSMKCGSGKCGAVKIPTH